MTTAIVVTVEDDRSNPFVKDLYEVLGVASHASMDDVRKAYRRASMKFHPDRSTRPDAAQLFRIIQEAYDVLSDPVLRPFYDMTGQRRPDANVMETQALNIVKDTFNQVFDLIANNPDPMFDVDGHDPVTVVCDAIMNGLKEIDRLRGSLQVAIRRQEKLLKRFKKKNAEFATSMMGTILNERIKNNKKVYALSELDIIVHQRALVLAADYTCDPELTRYGAFTSTITVRMTGP